MQRQLAGSFQWFPGWCRREAQFPTGGSWPVEEIIHADARSGLLVALARSRYKSWVLEAKMVFIADLVNSANRSALLSGLQILPLLSGRSLSVPACLVGLMRERVTSTSFWVRILRSIASCRYRDHAIPRSNCLHRRQQDDVKAFAGHLLGNTAAHGSCSYHTDFKYLFFIQILLYLLLYLNNFEINTGCRKGCCSADYRRKLSPFLPEHFRRHGFRSGEILGLAIWSRTSFQINSGTISVAKSFVSQFKNRPFRPVDSRLLYVARILPL